jgi:hypothetical protein
MVDFNIDALLKKSVIICLAVSTHALLKSEPVKFILQSLSTSPSIQYINASAALPKGLDSNDWIGKE